MNAAQLKALDQRLDQHADATEIILKRLDEVSANVNLCANAFTLLEARIAELESIVLPDSDKRRSTRPSETPP